MSVLTARSLAITGDAFFAPDDVEVVSQLFGSLPARRTRLMLTLQHDDGRLHVEEVEALVVPGPPDESRLGMDVLNRWTPVLDGPTELVLVEPAES